MVIDPDFWNGRRVFLTGHTGFKGGWLSLWLRSLGANVTGFALNPPTSPSLFEVASVKESLQQSVHGDIRELAPFIKAMQTAEPEIVIHMAAQSLVRESYADPVDTYSTNVMGTVNMLEAARNTPSVLAVLNITTDKCYENNEWIWGYRENEPMGGHDPYSSSKGCAELISSAYRRSFLQDSDIALATARAGNVIGGGDWGKDRIIPDAIHAFTNNKPLLVRNPLATRPWQHVLEPLTGYLMLCQQLLNHPKTFSQAWNFGPKDKNTQSVAYIADIMTKNWGSGAKWQLDEHAHPHEAQDLKLDCAKSTALLKWSAVWGIEKTLNETAMWYKAWHNRKDMLELTLQQISSYENDVLSS